MRIDPADSDHLPAPWKDVTAPPPVHQDDGAAPNAAGLGATTASAA
jgi:hypothetical protein